jgi:hypothetical protein
LTISEALPSCLWLVLPRWLSPYRVTSSLLVIP